MFVSSYHLSFSKRGYANGSFKYFKSLLKIGMFPMTPVKASRIAHRIKSPMGWGCRDLALNSRMKSSAVKADGTGEAPHFSVEQVTDSYAKERNR